MNVEYFAAGAVIIGALVSLTKPENTLLTGSLSPKGRMLLALALGALQACLQAAATGTPILEAAGIAAASVITALVSHGTSVGDKPSTPNLRVLH